MRNSTVPLKELLVRKWRSSMFNFVYHVEDNNFTACDTPSGFLCLIFQVTSLAFHRFWSSISSQACTQNSNPLKWLCLTQVLKLTFLTSMEKAVTMHTIQDNNCTDLEDMVFLRPMGFWHTSQNCHWLISLHYTKNNLVMDCVSYNGVYFLISYLEHAWLAALCFLGCLILHTHK